MGTGFQSVFILGTLDNLQKLISVALIITIRQCGDYKGHSKKVSMPFFLLFAWQYITVNVYKAKLKAYGITPEQEKKQSPTTEVGQLSHHSKENKFRPNIKMQLHFKLYYQTKYKVPDYSAWFLYYKNGQINLQWQQNNFNNGLEKENISSLYIFAWLLFYFFAYAKPQA